MPSSERTGKPLFHVPWLCYDFGPAVSVAQSVEHRIVDPRVVGSNPIAHPN